MTIYNQSADMTTTLNANSYWASYNNVYFPDFRNISGEDQMVKTKGSELYSWYNSSRARIFRRDHHNVVDLSTMMHMMRFIFKDSLLIPKYYFVDTMIFNMMNYQNVIARHRFQQN